MRSIRGKLGAFVLLAASIVFLAACADGAAQTGAYAQIDGLQWQEREELSYAEGFSIDKYEGGWRLLTISDGSRYLVVPEGLSAPEGLENDIHVINRPVSDIYMAASAVMDMFRALDAIDAVRLSGLDADGWYIEEAKQAIEDGRMLYAGKYNAPDYELILSQGCTLAIENTMLLHAPEVQEQLEKLGITVFTDWASYESHPLGRVEWVKLYGALLGREDEAAQAFAAQEAALRQIEERQAKTAGADVEKTVAFFYITSAGAVSVRSPSDYIPKLIEMAGGKYVFDDLEDAGKKQSSVTLQAEEFYARAKSADYLIYNSATGGGYESLDALLDDNGILEDFDAVHSGNIWCTAKNLYQESMSVGGLLTDICAILNDENPQTKYIYRLE
ncbi:MAG: ABC transporter substrate-binding protein [Lachnospiraceae bacterium]|nr:ABC transporter substrate-binding protein [Lachnospiraceae bacterium]